MVSNSHLQGKVLLSALFPGITKGRPPPYLTSALFPPHTQAATSSPYQSSSDSTGGSQKDNFIRRSYLGEKERIYQRNRGTPSNAEAKQHWMLCYRLVGNNLPLWGDRTAQLNRAFLYLSFYATLLMPITISRQLATLHMAGCLLFPGN